MKKEIGNWVVLLAVFAMMGVSCTPIRMSNDRVHKHVAGTKHKYCPYDGFGRR